MVGQKASKSAKIFTLENFTLYGMLLNDAFEHCSKIKPITYVQNYAQQCKLHSVMLHDMNFFMSYVTAA